MYTQAGDKVKAMKCLLRSGDTQKICYFAGVSRNRDIYILAANYLQNLDWKADPEIVKNIVQFYSKAKALDSLAAFFDSCAQIEIDDYRDYEKALGALREAHEWMAKARVQDKDAKVASLAQRISHVEAFVRARKTVKTEPEETVRARTAFGSNADCMRIACGLRQARARGGGLHAECLPSSIAC